MTAHSQIDVAGPQREVQQLLGRCLLRLQEYERLLKRMIAAREFSGTPATLLRNIADRRAEAAGKTLGILVGRLLGDYIQKEGSDTPEESPSLDGPFHLSFQTHVHLPEESHEALKADLSALVTMRNRLVHHFIEMHDLQTIEGCLLAHDELLRCCSEIDRHLAQLCIYAGHLDQARNAFAELVQSPEFLDSVLNGIGPDGQICWPAAGIVAVLREALQELSVGGWANLDSATSWAATHYPEQTPQKYGCVRWRDVIHQSGLFDLRRFEHNGQWATWLRDRPRTAGSIPGMSRGTGA